mmetsp:Transcript_25587/g.55512  ORF Transcript_25587/g.55512 Transcript_25587/m.55512 type:complete len:88 (-) Transcript_25587:1083-1346(-)
MEIVNSGSGATGVDRLQHEVSDVPYDEGTKKTVGAIPLCKTRAGPRDGEKWKQRFKEELESLIQYVKINKENDNDWFSIRSDTSGIR